MSHWPRKFRNRRRRRHFWTKLLLVSFVAHSAFLFSVLFLYKGDYFSYDVTVSTKLLRSGAPVIFMPFHKIVNKQPVVSTVKSVLETGQKTKMSTTTSRKKRTTVAAVSQLKKKLVAKKEQAQKKWKKAKVALKKKKEAQKTVPKKQMLAVTKKAKSIVKKIVAQKPERLVAQAAQPKPNQTPLYVGQVEMEALRMQEQLQREMSQHWKPPVGLSKDLKCVLKVLIDWSGNVNETEVHKSSGVLMYDISARTAVAQMQMPQWARGKEFNITFKQ